MADTELPRAIARALPLLDVPENPDTTYGYVDLIGGDGDASPGPIQSLWSSSVGTDLYDRFQTLVRRVSTMIQPSDSALGLPVGGRALDVGCGPGNVTAKLGRLAGPEGLALGVDVSDPMLRRAVHESGNNVGFFRADARRLPFHDGIFDTVTSLLALQLIPDPLDVLDEMGRVVVPGGHVVLLMPTPRDSVLEWVDRLTGSRMGLNFFDPDELAARLRAAGFSTVHTRQKSAFLWVFAEKGATAPGLGDGP